MSHWGSDPCKVLERSEQQITCPACVHNEYQMIDSRKRWYCVLDHDQNGGLRGQRDCDSFFHKGLARERHASTHDKGK